MQSKSSIRWNCRRGKLELDIMLERFVEQRLDGLSAEEFSAFERFLDLSDEIMLDFLLERAAPAEQSFQRLTQMIRECS